jgi:hypothetical protein
MCCIQNCLLARSMQICGASSTNLSTALWLFLDKDDDFDIWYMVESVLVFSYHDELVMIWFSRVSLRVIDQPIHACLHFRLFDTVKVQCKFHEFVEREREMCHVCLNTRAFCTLPVQLSTSFLDREDYSCCWIDVRGERWKASFELFFLLETSNVGYWCHILYI